MFVEKYNICNIFWRFNFFNFVEKRKQFVASRRRMLLLLPDTQTDSVPSRRVNIFYFAATDWVQSCQPADEMNRLSTLFLSAGKQGGCLRVYLTTVREVSLLTGWTTSILKTVGPAAEFLWRLANGAQRTTTNDANSFAMQLKLVAKMRNCGRQDTKVQEGVRMGSCNDCLWRLPLRRINFSRCLSKWVAF